MALLECRGVNVAYEPNRGQRIWAVRDVDLALEPGEFVGIVGESGCGKSTLGYALIRMLRPPARLESGAIRFDGVDIATLHGEKLRRQRRNGFALVLQSGMNALNPVRTIEHHFGDLLKAHARPGDDLSARGIARRGAELLEAVRLESGVLGRFPHELSGGMRQRISIALALALEPRLIVFDEPTTALDVIVQRAVMQTIKDLQRDRGFTAAADKPRPRCRARGDRPGHDHVRGPDRRGSAGRRAAAGPAPSVHRGAAGLLCRPARGRRPAGGHPWRAT